MHRTVDTNYIAALFRFPNAIAKIRLNKLSPGNEKAMGSRI